jgi:hypothetical protein
LIVSGSASARNSARKRVHAPEPFCRCIDAQEGVDPSRVVLGRLTIAFGHLAEPTQLLVTNPRRMLEGS